VTDDSPASRLIIRPAAAADLPAIITMLADDHLGRQREFVSDPPAAGYLAALAIIDADPNQIAVAAELDGRVVGTLHLSFIPSLSYQGGWRAELDGVRVHPDYRGRGIGRQMIRWAIDRARERDCVYIYFISHKSRLDAHRFYEGLGFVASHQGMKLALKAAAGQ
jgi:GNAT superfamily N-acetyltransferase